MPEWQKKVVGGERHESGWCLNVIPTASARADARRNLVLRHT